ncbi:hypothetical protein M0208_03935 [Sphingomonas sp. SUN019]|uniref:hypothetical protein n=1 Tax=Sphingomonas sp. SUN019 TaxID=2937788 RepID=UPI00216414C4|nr:hypothetical protein [Sphingomonas sp. SUN019]UVO49701.1 hypothetical protein M0208_03935 [Sphingomonas sp. SUN019]
MMRTAIVREKPAGTDLGRMAKDMLQPWADAYENWRTGVAGMLDRRPAKGDCCAKCAPDDCSCRCCVADSDLLVEARVGERRVVPITIENHWRRERDIELELSSWTNVDGVQISGQIAGPTSFKLEPCGEARVVLVIEIGGGGTDDNQRTGDVRQCAVAYADLRVKGCDIRPIRIAVAVLPRDCDDYVVDCRCGCC